LEGLCGLPFVKHGHVINSAVSFHKCVHFWDCIIFAIGCSYFSFLPYLVGIYLKLSFTLEYVIVLMWVYAEIIVFLTMHSHIICTLVLMDLFELWWLNSISLARLSDIWYVVNCKVNSTTKDPTAWLAWWLTCGITALRALYIICKKENLFLHLIFQSSALITLNKATSL
jgi:hypothetical protein